MPHMVLGIGYHSNEYEALRREWQRHDVDFHFVDSTEDAVRRLRHGDYVCITVRTNYLEIGQLEALRSLGPTPIVVLSPQKSVSQRADHMQRGADDFILNANLMQKAKQSGKDAVQYYLYLPDKGEEPLTIVTTGELYFCLEYRTVEVRGQRVDLTAKEFDILALLITHPKRVYTFELMMDLVWKEEYTYFSHKTLVNHMSNLRKKLKIQPDVPNFIMNIHGVGYKFDVKL